MRDKEPPSFHLCDEEKTPKPLGLQEAPTQSIDLGGLLTNDLTPSGSFDIRDSFWSTTFGKVIQALPIPAFLIDKRHTVLVANQACARITSQYDKMQGASFFQFFPGAADAERIRSALEDVFSSRRPRVSQSHMQVDGARIWGRLTFRSIRMLNDRLVLALVEDLTNEKKLLKLSQTYQKELEQRVSEETARRTQELTAIATVSREVTSSLSVSWVLACMHDQIMSSVDPDVLLVYLLEGDSLVLHEEAAGIVKLPRKSLVTKHLGEYLGRLVAGDGKPLYVWDILTDSRCTLTECQQAGMRSFAALPLVVEHEVVGVLGLGSRIERDFSARSLFLEAICAQVAVGIRNARLYELARRRAEQLEEHVTELKCAQEALRQSEEKYRTIIEIMPEGYFEVDLEGNMTLFNDAMVGILGYAREELNGMNYRTYTDKETAKKVYEQTNSVYRTGMPVNLSNWVIIRKDGARRIMETPLALRQDSDGRACGFRGLARDITEKMEAEEALAESESRFRCITENVHDLVCETDARATYRYISPSYERVLGYEPQDLLGESVFARIHPDDQDRVKAEYQDGVRTGADREVELRYRHADGSYKWLRSTGSFLFDAEGAFTGAVISTRDVTERMLAEDRLRESEERFRAIFESSRDCVFIKDRSGMYSMVNPAFANFLELPASEVIGKTDEEVFGPEIAEKLQEVDSRVLMGQIIEREHTVPMNGIPVTLLLVKVPLHNATGEIFGIGGIAHNITERKNILTENRVYDEEYPSPAMRSTLSLARLAAKTDSLVLLTGESGSGKDVVARYIHEHSRRSGGPFFAINCAAVPQELAESELFGHERGAFTGADRQKRGLLELAEGGTILLNEIGELALPLQAKLLSFLDTRSFTRVGGEKSLTVSARLIMATNRDLAREVQERHFRKDLYYRINVLTIRVPPLRERLEDIPVLVRRISTKLAAELQVPGITDIDEMTLEKLRRHDWPGNVRELRNEVERALILFTGISQNIKPSHMEHIGEKLGQYSPWSVADPTGNTLNEMVQEFKKSLIEQALERSHGKRVDAARLLGISRDALKQHMKSLGLLGQGDPSGLIHPPMTTR
ncbi:MAG TPA: PAS domain S-box protein [Desulfomonilaceae bacterium]|nr:PAS domain S-box protein [Desulfomonilaceae bacterium]